MQCFLCVCSVFCPRTNCWWEDSCSPFLEFLIVKTDFDQTVLQRENKTLLSRTDDQPICMHDERPCLLQGSQLGTEKGTQEAVIYWIWANWFIQLSTVNSNKQWLYRGSGMSSLPILPRDAADWTLDLQCAKQIFYNRATIPPHDNCVGRAYVQSVHSNMLVVWWSTSRMLENPTSFEWTTPKLQAAEDLLHLPLKWMGK